MLYLAITIFSLVDEYQRIIIWLIYTGFNLKIASYANSVSRIVFWLIFLPLVTTITLLYGKNIPVNFFEAFFQFIILSFFYGVIWVWGAFHFDKSQYKVAISGVAAILTTILAIAAYIFTFSQEFTERYKIVQILLSPLIVAGVWGKVCLDLREKNNWTSETLKKYFPKKIYSILQIK